MPLPFIQAGLGLASGIGSFIQGRKIAKRQQKEAEAERGREAAARGKRDALLQEGLSGARMRASAGQMPGFTTAKEMQEKQTATAIDAAKRGTTSGSDYLATISGMNQQAQQNTQNLALQNAAWQDSAFNQLLSTGQNVASYSDRDATMYGQRAGELSTAAQQNKANALKGLFGGMVSAAGTKGLSLPSFGRGVNIGMNPVGRKTTTMSGTGAGMNLF